MHFENARPRAITPEREADLDGGLVAEPPHAAIAPEQTVAARTVRVTINHGSLRDSSALTTIPAPAATKHEQDLQSLHQ
jgi:hypothetical protein